MTSARTPAYRGDRNLARLLAAAGSDRSVADIQALAAGIAAAPAPSLPLANADRAWRTLLALPLAPEIEDEIEALVRGHAARFAAAPAASHGERLAALRAELARRGVDGFLVPHTDEHHNEFLPKRAERLTWLTGFTGSAGLAVVLADEAAIFIDGRYTLQVRDEVDTGLFTPRHVTDEPASDWIGERLAGGRLGYDPWLHSEDEVKRFAGACEKAGGTLVPLEDNPLDTVWEDQPPPPLAPVVPHDIAFAGQSSADKRTRLAAELANQGIDAALISAPDSLAWLLNIRGCDVPCTPLPLGFALLNADATVDLFIDARKCPPDLAAHLGNQVRAHPPAALADALAELGARRARVRVDPATAAAWLFDRLDEAGAVIERGADPCAAPKALKNAVELDGTRAAHRRDGAALTRFLAWLARTAPQGGLDELAVTAKLAAFRAENERIQSLSFNTIAGAGANGAIVHYRASASTNRRLEPGELFLLDSGAQYLDGTTDVTRTVAIGTPSPEMRDRFTRVLLGHIALATCRFPRGTTGSQLDTLARTHLWRAGLDYDHGTGHGVGSYLGVHEGPQRISKLPNKVALEPGMIVSNEPGFYKAGAYGIRIENLVAVVEAGEVAGGEKPLLAFETLTRAPIERSLIEPALMSEADIAWLDAYHAQVRGDLTPLVDAETAAWLERATAPLAG